MLMVENSGKPQRYTLPPKQFAQHQS